MAFEEDDDPTSSESNSSKDCGCEKAVGQEGDGRDSIDDGKYVIGLKRPNSKAVVTAMEGPAWSKVMPQRLVSPPSPHLHANLK